MINNFDKIFSISKVIDFSKLREYMSYKQALFVNSLGLGDVKELRVNPIDWKNIKDKLKRYAFAKTDYGRDNFLLHGIPTVEDAAIDKSDIKVIMN